MMASPPRQHEFAVFGATGSYLGTWVAETDYEALAEFNEQRGEAQELGTTAEDLTDLRGRDGRDERLGGPA